MIVGVIGSGSIGPDLAYGFVSALARGGEGRVILMDIRQEALDAARRRIEGYVQKGLSRGKLAPKAADFVGRSLTTTTDLGDLAACEYVLEAATENLEIKQGILRDLEGVVGPNCLIGFATSGLPRARIAAKVARPERCFVNHPFYPAWRSTPVEVVLSGDEARGRRMLETLRRLGKVPIVTADVPCFAADDVFCNYCAEAARLFVDGVASPAQIDRIVNDAIGGGGPFNVMDLTRGNLLNIHCLELMRDAPTGGPWFDPPAIFAKQANTPWHDRDNPGDPAADAATRRQVLDRILAVLFARSFFVVDHGVCHPREFNWLSRNALGFRAGLLDLAEEYGIEKVADMCERYAAANPGFEVPPSLARRRLPDFTRHVEVGRDGSLAVVAIRRPEVMNALNERTLEELQAVFAQLADDPEVEGVVLTSWDGSLAGADINELAALKTTAEAEAKCRHGQRILDGIAALGKPVVAAVDGPVLGGGCEIAMACHARVAGPALMLGQPEVNLGITPGYGGTQRLPRLIGPERALELLRTGRAVGAREACAWGWAHGEPAPDPLAAAKALLRSHLAGEVTLAPVDPGPVPLPRELPPVDLGHHSLAVDAILVDVIREGLNRPLAEGLLAEARGFARCKQTVDYGIGMTNFIVNGPRVPAEFLHE